MFVSGVQHGGQTFVSFTEWPPVLVSMSLFNKRQETKRFGGLSAVARVMTSAPPRSWEQGPACCLLAVPAAVSTGAPLPAPPGSHTQTPTPHPDTQAGMLARGRALSAEEPHSQAHRWL